jgi:predicted chitinase
MESQSENSKQQSARVFSPALVAILGMLGAAIAPSVQFVNGYWQNKLKEKEIVHQIALDFAKLAISEKESREYRLDTLKVISSIPGNPLQEWAKTAINEEQKQQQALMAALYTRVAGPTYKTFSECKAHLEQQLLVINMVMKETYGKKEIQDTIVAAVKDNYTVQVEQDCRSLQGGVLPNDSPDIVPTSTDKIVCKGKVSAPKELNEKILSEIFSKANPTDIKTFLPLLQEGMQRKNINTCQRMAMFLVQIGHMSGEFRFVQEVTSGAAYEGRRDLGNTQPGDGPLFKGRGLLQITGRANYSIFSKYANKPEILMTPDIVASDPFLALETALWYWELRDLNKFADNDDVEGVTKRIYGSSAGRSNLTRLYEAAKSLL